jgi:crotonobetainyl-CoA:carnitine CoA-transferase CaiB-like acyl-CoA transferase
LNHVASALGSLRVVDFSRVLAGPFATMMLADLGALVTKIERPPAGDETRAWGPPYDERGEATYFQALNRNKRTLALDLGDPRDLDRARELALDADILVENFRPGVMERIGLGFDQLHEANPPLIYCSITGFGRAGGAELPGYDLLIQAVGGLMSITGEPDGPPQKVGVALVDVLAGLFATVGILAALSHRERSGEGQRVDVSLLVSLLAALVNQGSAYTVAGALPARLGNDHPSVAPYGLVRCGSGDLVLAVGNDQQFEALCAVIEQPALAADPRFATNGARVEHAAELRRRLERALASAPASAWTERLLAAGVPAGVVNDISQAFELAARLGLAPTVAIAREDGSAVELTRNPIELSATPPSYRSAPPSLPAA